MYLVYKILMEIAKLLKISNQENILKKDQFNLNNKNINKVRKMTSFVESELFH